MTWSKWVLFIFLLIVVAPGIFYAWNAHAPTKLPIVLASDLYPLYTASWSIPHSDVMQLSTSSVAGASIHTTPVTGTMDPGSIFFPFTQYYRHKLLAAGWVVDNYLEAGGPLGGQSGYRKGNALIVVSYHVVFHTISSTTPVQCPCDVTLSLFSATQ